MADWGRDRGRWLCLQRYIAKLVAGLLILLRLPFRRGDQIQIGESEGTVVGIEPRATVLKTYDGRVIVVPNTEVYTSHVLVSTAYDIRRVEWM